MDTEKAEKSSDRLSKKNVGVLRRVEESRLSMRIVIIRKKNSI